MRTLILLLLMATPAAADTLGGHATKMANRGAIWHDRNRGRGAEVVAKVRRGFLGIGERAAARAAWMRSTPHRAILKSPGWLRIRCRRGYCVGRK